MYDLPYHKAKDPHGISAFIAQYPFAFLTGGDASGRPVATQLPLFLEEDHGRQVLRGHIMKNTDHHKAFIQNENVLAVFTGPHTYVSGTWYSQPHTPSTWNYMSVQVSGKIRFVDDAGLKNILRKTTLHFENHNPHSTTVFDNLPEDFISRAIQAIVGFEVEVTAIDHVFKLSQDRDYASYLKIMEKLRENGGDGEKIAEEMEKRIGDVFAGNQNIVYQP